MLGLVHENGQYNIMGTDFTHIYRNGNTAYSALGEDAASGLVALYNLSTNSSRQDVGIAHWLYYGANGEYSRHSRTNLTNNTNGADLPFPEFGPKSIINFTGERIYKVLRGQTIKKQLIENNGKSAQSGIFIKNYLSGDSNIKTGDTLLDTNTLPTIVRDMPYQYIASLTIPSSTPVGYYFLGAIIDPNNALTEVHESNNVATWAVHVQ
ncbi:MAG: hypothetical protein KDG89_17340 [Geminicoccaceae bacterium]|nr:hypothetical protein [Geminicoccaceae bacterium]